MPQDKAAAVETFKQRWTDARPMKLVGDYYLGLGDRKTAAIYYRTAMRWTPNLDDQVNGYPAMIRWMRSKGFSPCGASGPNSCAALPVEACAA